MTPTPTDPARWRRRLWPALRATAARRRLALAAAVLLVGLPVQGAATTVKAERARALGVPFQGTPGRWNAITDVPGVEVGHRTLISGSGRLSEGKGPVRTGVTVIHPLGKRGFDAVAAGRTVINGAGEFTGMAMVDELGELFGPIALTGTGNLSVVHQALVDWSTRPGFMPAGERFTRMLPAVGETLDLGLNDVFGHPMTREDVFKALDEASTGPVAEGNVGGGTGMVAYYFKGGIGTSSRVITAAGKPYVVGVLVQTNHGSRKDLRISGVPVGEQMTDLMPIFAGETSESKPPSDKNSLLIVIATDAPLQPHQLSRLARRATLGVGRNGSTASNFSGEFALAFSVSNTFPYSGPRTTPQLIGDNDSAVLDALFAATVQAVEEAIVNQLVASETMTGADGNTVYALPKDRLVGLLKQYNRLNPPARSEAKRPPAKASPRAKRESAPDPSETGSRPN